MAASPRRLVFVLTMGAWLAASINTGSSSSGWWGSKEALQLRQAARHFSSQGNFVEAERAYRRGADLAVLRRDPEARAWFLEGCGDASLVQLHYRAALTAYTDAKRAAEQARDPIVLGAVEANLASLYQQMGDFEAALRSAQEAYRFTRGLSGVYYRPHLLLLLGRLQDDATSIPLFREGIQAAHSASAQDPSLVFVEANGWDYLSEALLERGDLEGAGQAAQQAIALHQAKVPQELGFPEWLLAEVRIKQARQATEPAIRENLLEQAESFAQAAARARRGMPGYALASQRGRILLMRGRMSQGLAALEDAIAQVQEWRAAIVATPGSLDGSAERLQATTFDEFIFAAAAYGMKEHRDRWIDESFQATELNRTINLRDSILSSRRTAIPSEYWDLLSQLQTEDARLKQSGQQASRLSDSLRSRLSDLEARSGLGYSPKFIENFLTQASLIHFQASLGNSDLFLSLTLGKEGSLLWAVTGTSLHMYRLPAAGQIVSTVRDFQKVVKSGAEEQGFRLDVTGRQQASEMGPGSRLWLATECGHQLYSMLFGQLQAAEASKPNWKLSVDDVLLEVPFAALVPDLDRRSHRRMYLVEQHSLEVLAGALAPALQINAGALAPELQINAGAALAPGSPEAVRWTAGPGGAGFLGVGDPIYNTADSRWTGAHWTGTSAWHWFNAGAGSEELNRLPGSGREVETSARAWQAAASWQSESQTATVLLGADATRTQFLRAIAAGPRIIHLATHALNGASSGEAYLALSLDRNGRPEMLGTSEVRTLRVPGSLVAMTGCDTAPSQSPAGLALAGLVRAWTIAGASAVVATEWPVEDAAGASLLASFYRHLRTDRQGSPAAALREAQVEAIQPGVRSLSAWAAYQVFAAASAVGSETP